MTNTPAQLTFTAAKARFRLLTATGRHGEHWLKEEAFTWTYTLIRTNGSTITAKAGFRTVAEQIAQAVENANDPNAAQIYAIAHETYRAHQATNRRI
ncbi:hypothetical protein ACH4UT_10375 [Streptomyces sp. NPDC020799]|uniref:hypothetical protein n=1 Tax=Streptomyces sp. NPDC020799 TaxID=3365091 RepID=UPI0037B7C580